MAKQEKKPKTEDDNKFKLTDKERVVKGQILARIVIEVLGAPKEHVEEAIKLVVDRANKLKDAEVVSESTYEAEEKTNKLFSSFSELEIWFKNIDVMELFIFEFTPSSVEVIQPEVLPIKNRVLSGFFNDFLLKMHDLALKMTDTAAKMTVAQKNADVLVRNFIHYALLSPKSIEEVSKIIGLPKENAEAILANFVKAGVVAEKDGKFVNVNKHSK